MISSLFFSNFLNGKENGEIPFLFLVEKGLNARIENSQDLISYYSDLVSLLFLRKLSSSYNEKIDKDLPTLIKKGKLEAMWKTFPLQEGYQTLISYLYDESHSTFEMKQLEKGAVLQESGSHSMERQLPSPMENGKLALICLYLGWMWQDEELMQKGIKLTEFCLSLCDHDGKIFHGLWMRESEFNPKKLELIFALLFAVVAHISASSKVRRIADIFLENIKNDPSDLLIGVFAYAFQKLIDEKIPYPKLQGGLTLFDLDRSLGYMRYQYGDMSLACAASGVNTGLGVIHKKGIHFVNLGPHFAPLSDSSFYGIFRPSNGSQEGFKDLKIELEDKRAQFRGWMRTISPAPQIALSNHWLFFDLQGDKEKIHLTVRQNRLDETFPLCFVFFVSAEKVIINEEKEFYSKGLEKYQGKCSKILFDKGGEKVTLSPHFDGEMEVIPLAGKDHFWSADFLVAFPMKKKLKPFSWDIE